MTLKQIYADTEALKRIRRDMERELDGELTFQIDMNIELESETKKWSK